MYILIAVYSIIGICVIYFIINNFIKPAIMRRRGHFCHNCDYCHGYDKYLWFCYSPRLEKNEQTGSIRFEPVNTVFGHIYKCHWKESRDKCQKP